MEQSLVSRPQQQTQSQDNGGHASPEEQAAYEYYSTLALDFLTSESTQSYIAGFFKKGDPIAAMGRLSAVTYMRINEQNKDKGGVPDEVAMEVISDIIESVIDIAIKRGYVDEAQYEGQEQQLLEKVFATAYKEYIALKEKTGNLDPEQEAQNAKELLQSDVGQQAINVMSNEAAAQTKQAFGMGGS